MDPLSDILISLKPQSHRAAVLDLGERFSLEFPDQKGALKCNAVHSGSFRVEVEGAAPVYVHAGDFFFLPLGRPFIICSDPDISPTPFSSILSGDKKKFRATIGGGGYANVISCRFDLQNVLTSALLSRLPPIIVIDQKTPDARKLSQLVQWIVEEQSEDRPGCSLALQHLSHLILIKTLRLAQSHGNYQMGWLSALAHPSLCKALDAIHDRPGNRWTLDSLAEQSSMSRASFARNFREYIDQTPIEYLTHWRMLLAIDRLRDGHKIAQIARDLGYGSESAFSLAFKRVMGDSPRRYVLAN